MRRMVLPELPRLDAGKRVILFDTGFGEVPLFGAASEAIAEEPRQGRDQAGGYRHGDPDPRSSRPRLGSDEARTATKTFPNAELFVSKVDFDFWTDEVKVNEREHGCLRAGRADAFPYKDRLTLIRGRTANSLPGISSFAFPAAPSATPPT